MLHLLNRLPNFIKHNMDVPVLERTFIDDIKRLIEDARLNTYRQADRRAGAAGQKPCRIRDAVAESTLRRIVRGIR